MNPVLIATLTGAGLGYAEKSGVSLPLGLPTRTLTALAVWYLAPASALLETVGLVAAGLAASDFVKTGKVTGPDDDADGAVTGW
jgi:hypothetical protein